MAVSEYPKDLWYQTVSGSTVHFFDPLVAALTGSLAVGMDTADG